MMELNDIFALMDRFDSSGITSLEVSEGNLTLKLGKRAPQAAAPAASQASSQDSNQASNQASSQAPAPAVSPAVPAQAQPSGSYLRAPLVGTFYAASAPGQPPFVSVGDKVREGQTVCVLEAMKMMSEIPAPADCVIEEILVRDGELVSYDAPIFRIREVASC